MAIELIIFDLDGTLVDSIGDIAGAVNYALREIGLKSLTVDEIRGLVGAGVENLLLKAAGIEEFDTARKDLLKGHFLEHYTSHIADKSRPYENVLETLDDLSKMKKGVVSNKLQSLSRLLLEKLSMLRYFEAVYGYDTCGGRKPSPVPIIKMMEELRADPTGTIIVGDSATDIEAGHAAGIKAVAVSYGYRAVSTLSQADYIIDDISEIIPIIGTLS